MQSADVEDVVDQSILRLEYFEAIRDNGKSMLNSLRRRFSPLPRAVMINLLESLEQNTNTEQTHMIYMILHKMFSYDIAKHTQVAEFKKSFERSACV